VEVEKMGPILIGGIAMMIGMVAAASMVKAYEPDTPTPTGFKCPYCHLYFDTLSDLAAHVSTSHPDMPPIEEVDIEWS